MAFDPTALTARAIGSWTAPVLAREAAIGLQLSIITSTTPASPSRLLESGLLTVQCSVIKLGVFPRPRSLHRCAVGDTDRRRSQSGQTAGAYR